MPGLDGWQVARQVRAEAPSVLLVAVTGYASEQDRELSRQAGFDFHLVKPVDPLEFRRLLDAASGKAE
jgi:CheY-like chemotaxis protein